MIKRYRPRDWTVHPPYLHDPYRSTRRRSPMRPLAALEHSLSEVSGPSYSGEVCVSGDNDLTTNAANGGEAIGERLTVSGRVLDESGRPVRGTLIEVWQANAAGRYRHDKDRHDAPLDPNFVGAGRCLTDERGEYRFTSIRPGAYPWGNHPNAWRPAHIHFSLLGPAFAARLITQMYFPGDPLLRLDPIFNGVPDETARRRLVAEYVHELTVPGRSLGYRFDIVLRGRRETPMENRR